MTAAMSARRAAILCALMVAVGPMTLSLYTPALPVLTEVFDTTSAALQLTMTAYFVGFAFTQLACGPLSDAYGRRTVILSFTVVYMVGSAMAYFSPTVEWLLFARVVQGVGGAVGSAVSRAIVRDLYTGQDSARIMSTIGTMLALGPAVAPLIGGVTLELFSWHEIFLLMVFLGAIVLVTNYVGLPETNRYIDPANFRPLNLLANYAGLIRDVRFMRQGITLGLSLGSIYVLGTMLPFVIIDRLGYTPGQYGLIMMLQPGSFIVGSFTARWLYRRVDAQALVPLGLGTLLLAGLLFLALPLVVGLDVRALMVPVCLVAYANAFVLPATMTAGIAPFPKIAGSASALLGMMHVSGGLFGTAIASLFADTATGIALMLPAMAVGAAASYWGLGAAAAKLSPAEPHAGGWPAPATGGVTSSRADASPGSAGEAR